MSNGKTQQERLKAIKKAAENNKQHRLKELLKNFRNGFEQGLFKADPEEANRVLEEIESGRLQPTTIADIIETRVFLRSFASGELEEEDDFGELVTSLIETDEEVPKNDMESQLMNDYFLWVIFETEIDEGSRKEKVERVNNNLGFNVKSVKQLQKIVQETLGGVFKKRVQEVFKGEVPINKALDSETVLKIIKSKKDLQKLKIVLEAALPKKKKATPTATPSDAKPSKKPPRPSPPKQEKSVFGTKVIPKEVMGELLEDTAGGPLTTTIPEGELDKLLKQAKPEAEKTVGTQDEVTSNDSDLASREEKTEKEPASTEAKPSGEEKPTHTLEDLDNEIQKNPKLEFIIHALTGDFKAMESEGIHITKKQLFDFLIVEAMVDAFQNFAENRKSALQIMMDQKEDPYGPEELDGFCVELKALIKKYSEEKKEKPKKEDGFPVSASVFLSPPKDIAKTPPQTDQAGGAVETHRDASEEEPAEEGIQRIDDTQMVPGLQIPEAEEKPAEPKPIEKPKPAKKTVETQDLASKEKKPKKEDPDKMLERLARKDAPKEYEEWSGLFRLLHFGKLPGNNKFKNEIISKRKRILGTETANDYNQLRMKLRKGELRKFIDAKSPINALKTRLVPKELEGKKLSEKLREKIDEIMEIITKAKPKTKKIVGTQDLASKEKKPTVSSKPAERAEKAFDDIRKSVDAITDKKEKGTLLQKLEKYLKSTKQEEGAVGTQDIAPKEKVETHRDASEAPDVENLAVMVEKNDTLQPLIDDLEEIRKLVAKKEKLMRIGLTPKGFKDLESFGNKAEELEANNDPLVRASSRQELVKEYLKIAIKGNPSLLKGWDDKKSPKELAEILQNSWGSFLDKLKK